MPTAIVIGAGPGLGNAVARRFAKEGFAVALLARRQTTVDAAAADLADLGVRTLPLTADATDEPGLRAALDTAVRTLGTPDVVVYNAAIIQADAPGELSARGHLEAWAVNVVGALTAAGHLLPLMTGRTTTTLPSSATVGIGGDDNPTGDDLGGGDASGTDGGGTFLITGGMPEPKAAYTSLSLGKAGVRALAALLDEQYRAAGIHVGTVTVGGPIAPGTNFDPDDLAEHYWRLHIQPRADWQLEVVHLG